MFSRHILIVLFWAAIPLLFGFSGISYALSCHRLVHELTDVSRRAPSYVITSSSEPTISDSNLPARWYVAKDSVRYYTMVNGTAPKYAYCGTDNPIYIKDKIEKIDEGKEYPVIACLVDFDSSCKLIYNIKVRRCGQAVHYYLVPTDGRSAYCFEPSSMEVEAPAPNYTIPDNIQVSVALMYRRAENSSEPELDFKCNFGSANHQYYYQVSWVINGRIEKTFAPTMMNDADDTNLNETTLSSLGFKFGITIQCAVRVSSTATGYQTNPQMSDSFYAGIKVLTPQLTLTSGSSRNISLQPTIPLGCRRPYVHSADRLESCEINIHMVDPYSKYSCQDTSVATLSDQKLCGSKIVGWRNTTSHHCMHQHNVHYCSYSQINRSIASFSIEITVTNQLQYPKDKTFILQLKTEDLAQHPFWENAQLDDVTVLYTGGSQNTEWREKTCSVLNDPTLVTFDGPRSYMHSFGHYLMYRNTKYSAEVQIKTQKCDADHTSSCTCAAAIHAGGDVFFINVCSKIKQAEFFHCRGNVLNVREVKENEYDIYLPTGTKVQVKIKFWNTSNFLNVDVSPSPSDVNNTEGLCGNLNGDLDETVNDAYLMRWELQHSLFNTVRYNLPTTLTYDRNVCICPRNGENATHSTDKDSRAFCFTQQYATCTDNMTIQGERKTCTKRKKRSVDRHRRNYERLFALSLLDESLNSRVRKSTADSNLTEAQAYRECLDVFHSKPTYIMRNDLPDVAWTESLSACVNDMMIDGRDFWKEEAYNSWVSVVAQEIGRNGTFREEKPEIVRNFNSATCPSQCNGNGNCVNGTCVCRDDYVGSSCFVKKSAPLELTDIEGGGECDLADGDDCHECLQFHTENLLKGFKCKIITNERDENGKTVHSDEQESSGEYVSVFDGYCCPSAVEKRRKKRYASSNGFTVRYSVSISNDGIHFGPSRDVHVYDSACQKFIKMPSGDLQFSLKPETCYIENQCYRNNDRSIASPNLICCPPVTSQKWTDQEACEAPTNVPVNGDDNRKTTIVAVSVSVGILIIACVVLFASWNHKRKTWKVSKKESKPSKCPDYFTHLDFTKQPFSVTFQSGGKTTSKPGQ